MFGVFKGCFFPLHLSSRGIRNHRTCWRNRDSEASRSSISSKLLMKSWFWASRWSRSSKLSTKSKFGGFEELQIIRTVDKIEVPRPSGAPGHRKCWWHRASEASRSSKSGTQRGHGSETGGFSFDFGRIAELKVIENLDEINVRRLRGTPGRELDADTRARWGASAPHRASSIYIYPKSVWYILRLCTMCMYMTLRIHLSPSPRSPRKSGMRTPIPTPTTRRAPIPTPRPNCPILFQLGFN